MPPEFQADLAELDRLDGEALFAIAPARQTTEAFAKQRSSLFPLVQLPVKETHPSCHPKFLGFMLEMASVW